MTMNQKMLTQRLGGPLWKKKNSKQNISASIYNYFL